MNKSQISESQTKLKNIKPFIVDGISFDVCFQPEVGSIGFVSKNDNAIWVCINDTSETVLTLTTTMGDIVDHVEIDNIKSKTSNELVNRVMDEVNDLIKKHKSIFN